MERIVDERDEKERELQHLREYVRKIEAKLSVAAKTGLTGLTEKNTALVTRARQLKDDLELQHQLASAQEEEIRSLKKEIATLSIALNAREEEFGIISSGEVSDVKSSLLYTIALCRRENRELALDAAARIQTAKELQDRLDEANAKIARGESERMELDGLVRKLELQVCVARGGVD